MEVHSVRDETRVILEDLCRLCGAQDGRMLHLTDSFSILGATSSILHLLDSISVLLKVQGDCEELMPKHLCLSCFNTAVDIQAFIDSGVNFQKTTISQLFPNAKVQEAYELSFVSGYHGSSNVTEKTCPQIAEKTIKSNELIEGRSEQFLNCSSSLEVPASGLVDQNYGDKIQDVNSQTHIIDSCQDSQGIFESNESADKHDFTFTSNISNISNYDTNISSHTDQLGASHDHTDASHSKESPDSSFRSSSESSHTPTLEGKNTSTAQKRDSDETDALVEEHKSDKDHLVGSDTLESETTTKETEPIIISEGIPGSDGKLKKCSVCNKSFPRKSQLTSHLASHSENRPYECNICFLKFKYRRNLVEHSSIHTEVPSFICSVCGLTFKQKSNLLKHERTHRESSKLRYKCNLCSNEYSQSSHLKTHMKNIHGDNRGYTCTECNAVVLCQSSLRRHMSTVHAKSSKYTCPHCSKGFNNYQNYQGHIRRHTGERPYCCVACSKTFTTPKALSRHRLTHQGTKTHKCTQCSKAFLELCDLKRHVKRHLLKHVKKTNKMTVVKCLENTDPTTSSVDPGMSSINLMVLTDSLLFSESQQLLDSTESRATEVILPHGKLDTPKGVTAEQVIDTNTIMQSSEANLQQTRVALGKGSPNMEAVSLLADTAVLQPPEVITGITAPLDPSQVLQPTNIDVQDVASTDETSQVTISVHESPECHSASETTMVMLSSAHTPSDYLPVSEPENNTENTVIDGTRPQQGERVLSHATW